MYAQVETPKENCSPTNRQESREVANSVAQKKSNAKQGFGFVDNRTEAVAQRKILELAKDSPQTTKAAQFKNQLIQCQVLEKKDVLQKFDAGIGAGWHIHHGDHVKYDSNNATRVNFANRTKRQIGYAWEQVIQNNGLAATKMNADFIQCKTWIRNNIQ